MSTPVARGAYQPTPNDVGTLWMMRRHECKARCALIAWPSEWELRIIADGDILLAEHCPRGAEAFAIAERWRDRMIDQGWRQVTPRSQRQGSRDRKESAGTPLRPR